MQRPGHFLRAMTAAAATFVIGCGADLGDPDFSDHVGLIPPNQKFDEPDPFQPGKDRLSVDLFYEGGRSETIKINGFRTFFFVFGAMEVGRDTFAIVPALDRLEGEQSDQVTLVGTPFWGGGIIWEEPIDLSAWAKMFVSFKSSDPSFATFEITLLSLEGDIERSVVFDPTDFGYTNDGQWHSLEIDLQEAVAAGFNLAMVRSPFIIGAAGGQSGDTLLIDNLYFTKF